MYVSPLKALSYDIERNLRAPLRGIEGGSEGAPRVRVGIRTGDTPQRERAQMRRNPPDVLITTPESLYLMLTSRARETLRGVEWVIVDEIHAVAATKRGAHLALTLERLDALRGPPARPIQRIGLSATQRPLEEVARFMVGPRRRCRIVDASASRKPLDLRIHVPVESMTEPEATTRTRPSRGRRAHDPLDLARDLSRAAGADPRAPLDDRVRQQPPLRGAPRAAPQRLAAQDEKDKDKEGEGREVGGERAAERPSGRTTRAGEGDADAPAPREIARAHHGSLAREERMVVEELLKAGEIPCIVATSSLELGIDMGAVDLVVQVESPKSVAAGLQRIGRAGHNVGDTSKGRIFPKFRGDLLECAVVARRMREGAIEPTVVPRNPLDVLAQQIVAMAGAEEEGSVNVDELHAFIVRTHTYAELLRAQLENVLDMLDGRYPSSEFSELRPRIVWDRLAGTIRARRGARQLAVTNAGTIPDRGLYLVTLPDGRRVGELDEEMVYEARPGQVFLLGASSWRIEEIGRDRVIVTPAPGVPGAVPFWKGDGIGRPKELGEAVGAFARWAVDQAPQALERDCDLDPRAARNLVEYLREQQAATRVVPSDKTIVIERFRDEIGDWRVCVLSPYGRRIHAAWALALSARIREEKGLEADAIASDDGIVVHLPDADALIDPGEPGGPDANDAPAGASSGAPAGGLGWDPLELMLVEPEELEDLVVAELSSSALFGARFREAAARALLIPRAYPGRRRPLWQQRLKAQSLLEVARRYGEFPIVLEAYRECLRDVLDLPGLSELLGRLRRRELSVVEVETPTASPFASSLLFDYVATYMYEGDTPNAERRAAALSLDRDLLRELLGQEELRELIDADALAALEDDLQHRSPRTRAATRDELHDVLRRVGDLTAAEAAARVHEGVDAAALLAARARAPRRARAGGRRGALHRRRRRGLLSRCARRGGARGAARGVPRRCALGAREAPASLRAYARPVSHSRSARALRVGSGSRRSRAGALRGSSCAGSCVRAGGEREWCDAEVLRRLRRASLAVLRKEIEPADQRAFAAFLPAWQGVDRWGAPGERAGATDASTLGARVGGGQRPGAHSSGARVGARELPAAGRTPGRLSDAAGIERLREQLVSLQGLALTPRTWERDVLPRRLGEYSPTWIDALCSSGELVWVGAGALGRADGRVALYFREDAVLLGPPPRPRVGASLPQRPLTSRCARACGTEHASSPICSPRSSSPRRRSRRRCGIWCGPARSPTTPSRRCAPRAWLSPALRARRRRRASRPRRAFVATATCRASQRAAPRAPPRARTRRGAGRSRPLCLSRTASARTQPRAAARSLSCCWSATASSPASSSSPRACRGASRRSTPSSASWRRSEWRAAATSWRASAAPSSRCPARSSACALACPPRWGVPFRVRSVPPGRRPRSCWPPPTPRSRMGRRLRGRRARRTPTKAAPLGRRRRPPPPPPPPPRGPAPPPPPPQTWRLPPRDGSRAWRALTWCWWGQSRCSTSSAARARCRCSSPPRMPAWRWR